jgi:hypothetical protein
VARGGLTMGWEHIAREKRLAPIGEYRPEHYRVTVHDSFQQAQLRAAALAIRNGMTVPEFFRFCAEYVIDHHRELKTVRKVYRKGAREISAAVREPVNTADPVRVDQLREIRRREALEQFSASAWEIIAADREGKPMKE